MDDEEVTISIPSWIADYLRRKVRESNGSLDAYIEGLIRFDQAEDEGQRIQTVDLGSGQSGIVLYYLAPEAEGRKVLRDSAFKDMEYDSNLFCFDSIIITGTGVYLTNKPEHLDYRVRVDGGPKEGSRYWIVKVTLAGDPSPIAGEEGAVISDPDLHPDLPRSMFGWQEIFQSYPSPRSCRHWLTTAEAANPKILRVELFDPDAPTQEEEIEAGAS